MGEDQGKLVLVIEDEVHIQRLIQMILEKSGYRIKLANNGEEGLKYLAEEELPCLVLLDIMMPGIDGLQVLRTMKADSRTKDISVVMLTALAAENVVLEGAKLGVKDYIRKPFHPQELVDRVQKVVTAS